MNSFDIDVLLAHADSITDVNSLRSFIDLCDVWKVALAEELSQIISAERRLFLLSVQREVFRLSTEYMQNYVGGGIGQNVVQPYVEFENVESAMRTRITTGFIRNNGFHDIITFLADAEGVVREKIIEALTAFSSIKVYTSLKGQFKTVHSTTDKYITTQSLALYPTDDIDEWYEYVTNSIRTTIEEFQDRDSGWSLTRLDGLFLYIHEHNPLTGSCIVSLPPRIAAKRAVINMKNTDKHCFKYAILAALYAQTKDRKLPPHLNPCRYESYKQYEHNIYWSGLTFPVALTDISKFEKNNPNISVNVYTLNDTETGVVPLRLTKDDKDNHANILFVNSSTNNHYCGIASLSRLVSAQVSRHHGSVYVCNRCLHVFYYESKLTEHRKDCKQMNDCVKIIMPHRGDKIVEFKHYQSKIRAPFVIYADFESIVKPTCSTISSQAYAEHIPFSIGYYAKYSYDETRSVYKMCRDDDPAKWFVNELIQFAYDHHRLFDYVKPMIISNVQKQQYEISVSHM